MAVEAGAEAVAVDRGAESGDGDAVGRGDEACLVDSAGCRRSCCAHACLAIILENLYTFEERMAPTAPARQWLSRWLQLGRL